MRILYLILILLFSDSINLDNNQDEYQILNDWLSYQDAKEKLRIYYQFNTESFWIDNLEDSLFLANAMLYSKDKIDLFEFIDDFDLHEARIKISLSKQIDKEKINGRILITKRLKEPISEFSCPIIAEDKAMIFQRSRFVSTFDYLILLKYKEGKWTQIAQILLRGEFI